MENDKLIAELRRRGLSNGTSLGSHSGLCDAASDCIEGLVAQLKAKEYTIMGIMNAVDKWLDGDELKADEVNRAATMRENTLQIVDRLETQLAERDKQLGLAVEQAKLWGKGLIESNSDAHITTCTECGFPIPDYRVDKEISCSWCKATNSSANYAPAGSGYCKTTLDRKAKAFDKIFHSGRGGRVDDDIST